MSYWYKLRFDFISIYRVNAILQSYFCGHEPHCYEYDSRSALSRAKENINKFYPVVGVLERYNHLMPNVDYVFDIDAKKLKS